MGKVLDLDRLRKAAHFKKKKTRQKKESPYPTDLRFTVEYYDHKAETTRIVVIEPSGPFDLNKMTPEYKKLMVELMIRLTADICEGDPAMIVELQDWLEYSFMNRVDE